MFPTGKNNTVKSRSKIVISFLLSPPPPGPLALHHLSLAATCLCPPCTSERIPSDNRTVGLTERRMSLSGTHSSGLTESDNPKVQSPGGLGRSEWEAAAQKMALQGWGKWFKPFSFLILKGKEDFLR